MSDTCKHGINKLNVCTDCLRDKYSPQESSSALATGSEISWADMHALVKRLVNGPRGHRRAANLIREIASELAGAEACEDLANASTEVQRMLVLSWELRWDKARGKEGGK